MFWTSERSVFAPGEPIRGGIPLCFPWFGPSRASAEEPWHGFARIQDWELVASRSSQESSTATFRLTDTPASRRTSWPYRFSADYTVTVGETLQLRLEIENRDDRDFSCEVSLHSYFAIRQLSEVSLYGLAGREFSDGEPTGARTEGDAMVLDGPISRVFPATRAAILEDRVAGRRVHIEADGLDALVVWNPGPEKPAAMADFGDDEWPEMLCIENCAIGEGAVRLSPHERQRMTVTMRAEPWPGAS